MKDQAPTLLKQIRNKETMPTHWYSCKRIRHRMGTGVERLKEIDAANLKFITCFLCAFLFPKKCEIFVLAAEIPCEWKFATKFASECECNGLVHSGLTLYGTLGSSVQQQLCAQRLSSPGCIGIFQHIVARP